MKKCPTCQTEKPFDQFHKDRSKKDGFNLYCKPCTIAKQKEFQSRPPRHVDEPGTKTCQSCKAVKTPADFYKDKDAWDGLRRVCVDCSRERHARWRLANLGHAAEQQKKHRLANPERHMDYAIKHAYGLPPGTYAKMLADQNGRCAICGTDDTGRHKRFHVDHCHDTGRVRGLLCGPCNLGLGHFKHSTKIIQEASRYLSC